MTGKEVAPSTDFLTCLPLLVPASESSDNMVLLQVRNFG